MQCHAVRDFQITGDANIDWWEAGSYAYQFDATSQQLVSICHRASNVTKALPNCWVTNTAKLGFPWGDKMAFLQMDNYPAIQVVNFFDDGQGPKTHYSVWWCDCRQGAKGPGDRLA